MTQIVKGFPASMRAQAAALYWEAFGGKLNTVFGPDDRACAFIAETLRADHCFSALSSDGRLLGVAGFKSPDGAFVGGATGQMRAFYGRFGSAWRSAALWMLSHEVDNHRFLIDGIAVTREARGLGIGTALLAALCDEGHQRGYASIRLEVIDSNWRARALYEREGFVPIRTEKLGLLRLVFGFNAATTMVKPL